MQSFKIKSLKKISAIVAATIGMAAFQPAQAAILTTSGRILSVQVAAAPASNFITLQGLTSLGNCPNNGILGLPFILKDDLRGQQMYATALAAAASGSTVFVWVDDTNKDANGFCYAQNVFFVGN